MVQESRRNDSKGRGGPGLAISSVHARVSRVDSGRIRERRERSPKATVPAASTDVSSME
jgi:hypothetical protein